MVSLSYNGKLNDCDDKRANDTESPRTPASMLALELLKRSDAPIVRVKLADDLGLDFVQRDATARFVSGKPFIEEFLQLLVCGHGVTE
jgi:hypothetical protein